jgi:adenylate cyclase
LTAALLVLIAGGAWYFFVANRPPAVASNAPPPLVAQRLSIVVLPFANLSGDPAQDYLADALTDELTTALSRIRNSFVIARNTAFTYKGKPVDAKAIGRELGMRYVLEGSVQPSGAQMRVNAQLIDADGGAHLWADQFDTPRADLLKMQDEIVTRLRTRWQSNSHGSRPPVSNGRRREIPMPKIWLSMRGRVAERGISRQGSGRGLPSIRTWTAITTRRP